MPHEFVKSRDHKRQRSLGWLLVRWMEHFCVHGPGDIQGRPLNVGLPGAIPLSDELTMLTVDCYALDPEGRRLYDSAFFSRPKGADKSGHAARLGLVESLGPCRFAGWAEGPKSFPWGYSKGEVLEWMDFKHEYEPGDAMGRQIVYPFLRILATEEGQTGNVYDSIHFNLKDGPLRWAFTRADDIGLTRIYLPDGGEIRPSTASSAAKDGGKESWVNFDETHLYNNPELHRMYDTVRRNMAKRKEAEPWSFESSTMYEPSQGSVAQKTHEMAQKIRDNKLRLARLLFDHRQAPPATDLADEESLRAGLTEAYGDAAAYMPFDRIISEIWDLRNDVTDSRRYFLNQVTAAHDAWLAPHEWDACADETKTVEPKEMITLGADGSKSNDDTVLMGCRVSDSHLFPLGVWHPADYQDGLIPTSQVDDAVSEAFKTYDVVGFYSDVNEWESYTDKWEQEHTATLCALASPHHAIKWDMRRGREATLAAEAYHDGILERDLTHSNDRRINQYHYNARRRPNPHGVSFAKESPASAKKVDAVAAALLARKARQDYLALPENKRRHNLSTPYEKHGLRRAAWKS